MKWTLINQAGTNDPDTGDIYSGLDRFGRVKDNRWIDGEGDDLDRIQYGYDRASNRIWRKNVVAAALGKQFDELYTYDGVHRLKDMVRGTLNGGHTALTSDTFAESWTLDSTGNWRGFKQDDNGDGTWSLIQSRTANPVNEITDIAESVGPSWVTPAYNRAGNMTTMPQPATPTASYTATYDAWNRLVKITDGADNVSEYAYDGAKRRIVQKSYVDGVLEETRHLYYTKPSLWQVIEERVGTSPDPDRQFVWGKQYVDDLVVRDRDADENSTIDERLYACQDANWNVTAIANVAGDSQERYAYSAFGVPQFLTQDYVSRVETSFDWDTLFCGYRYESATSLFHIRNRIYNPRLGTWPQRDPHKYADGPSLYTAYFVPNGTDPMGTMQIGLKPCPDKKHCDDCVKDLMKTNDTLKKYIEALKEAKKKGKKGCDFNPKCEECDRKDLLGQFKPPNVILCWNNLLNSAGGGGCDGIKETLLHETFHQLVACLGLKVTKRDDKCSQCICDELWAIGMAGQCDDGSVYRLIHPEFKSKDDCLNRAPVMSCVTSCPGVIGSTPDEQKAMRDAAECNPVKDF